MLRDAVLLDTGEEVVGKEGLQPSALHVHVAAEAFDIMPSELMFHGCNQEVMRMMLKAS